MAGMNLVVKKWEDARALLLQDLAGCERITCLIPGWSPVELSEALHWLQASIYEGFYVRHDVKISDGAATVRFKIWEYGESEPEFPTL
jgi:hypothetical protein